MKRGIAIAAAVALALAAACTSFDSDDRPGASANDGGAQTSSGAAPTDGAPKPPCKDCKPRVLTTQAPGIYGLAIDADFANLCRAMTAPPPARG